MNLDKNIITPEDRIDFIKKLEQNVVNKEEALEHYNEVLKNIQKND